MQCGIYIAKNFEAIQDRVNDLEEDRLIVQNVREAFQAENLQFELVNLMSYEQALQIQIELQATASTVLAQFEQLIKFEEALYGTSALEKWQSVLAKKPDLSFIRDNCAVFYMVRRNVVRLKVCLVSQNPSWITVQTKKVRRYSSICSCE